MRAPDVVKLGGGVSADPALFDRALGAVRDASRTRPICVVPGGGPFADAVRAFAATHGISDDAAHWMAILATEQYAHVLAERLANAGAILVDEIAGVFEAAQAGRLSVFAPYRWSRAADVLPHSWEVTSDSIAGVVAGTIGARHLVLLKPVDAPLETLVDVHFPLAVPADLRVTALGPGGFERLADVLAS